jgi:type VI secretion system protein ImpM
VTDAGPAAGFHGKVPAKGDFVTRRLPRGFVDAWDAWLQGAVKASREALGEDWLPIYLTSPIWRFALPAGLVGEAAAGVLMPSVDRVGRYFPMTLACPLAGAVRPADIAGDDAWFHRAEQVALTSLDDAFDLDAFDREVEALGCPVAGPAAPEPPAGGQGQAGLRLALGEPPESAGGLGVLAHRACLEVSPAYSLWWTLGSDSVAPSMLVASGLPTSEAFAALLDGRFERWGWGGAPAMPVEAADG